MLKVGDKAPEFRVKTDEGKDVSLSDFRGKRVLLFFFPKANTSG
jgi:peroxiredoxin Q/BCP